MFNVEAVGGWLNCQLPLKAVGFVEQSWPTVLAIYDLNASVSNIHFDGSWSCNVELIKPEVSRGIYLHVWLVYVPTPLKINMEPGNHPDEKENHLPNLHFWVPC